VSLSLNNFPIQETTVGRPIDVRRIGWLAETVCAAYLNYSGPYKSSWNMLKSQYSSQIRSITARAYDVVIFAHAFEAFSRNGTCITQILSGPEVPKNKEKN
jgi:hypothetical protein